MPGILELDLQLGPATGPPPPFNAKDAPRDPREIMAELARKNEGTVAQSQGGRYLIFFRSANDALNCAVAAQTELEERNRRAGGAGRVFMRAGLHASGGDDDIFSRRTEYRLPPEDVAVAAQIMEAAPEGRIFLSESIFEKCQESWIYSFIPLGPAEFKSPRVSVPLYEAFSLIRLGRALTGRSAKATETKTTQCPNCKRKVARSLGECPGCGIIFAKFFNAPKPAPPDAAAEGETSWLMGCGILVLVLAGVGAGVYFHFFAGR